MKKILCALLALAVLTCLTGCSGTTTTIVDYDERILKDAEVLSNSVFTDPEENPFVDGSRIFEVEKASNNEFRVNVNGTEMIIRIPKSSVQESKPSNISNIKKKYNTIISSSRKLIYRYIEGSEILKDKEKIKEYIASLPVKEAEFDVGAACFYEDNTLYINKDNESSICEWMIVHEYVHAISYYTHDLCMDKETYAYNQFNEILTDLIAASLEPNISENIMSGYAKYYTIMYPYIHLFGKKVIQAYYYGGYDDLISKEEMDLFVLTIENWGAENSQVYYNNLLMKWYANFSNSDKKISIAIHATETTTKNSGFCCVIEK